MSVFNEFPYTNFHELNLDWLLGKVKETEEKIDNFILDTDDKIIDQVNTWLDEHPEATTTVQDGALTLPKFAESLKLLTVKDYVTPEMFGGVGDGVTDDSNAVQAAINDGRPVVLLGKTYVLNTQILLRSDLVIKGLENATLKWNAYTTDTWHIGGMTLENICIKDVNFDFGPQTSLQNSISILNSSKIALINCNITGGYGYAIRLNHSTDILIDHCIFSNITGAETNPGGAIYGLDMNSMVVSNCIFNDLDDHGVYIAGRDGAYNMHVNNNSFRNNGRTGLTNGAAIVLYANCYDIEISGNIIINCKTGIYGGLYSNYTGVNTNINVINNIIKGCRENGITFFGTDTAYCEGINIIGSVIDGTTQDAITLRKCGHCNVSKNIIRRTTRHGIALSNSIENIIDSNIIRQCSGNGVYIGWPDPATFNMITNNIMTTSGTYAGQYGLYIRNSDYNRAFNNWANGFSEQSALGGTHIVNAYSEPWAFQKSIYWTDNIARTQYHNVGDIVILTTPTAGSPAMYICTEAGNPGTLKVLATVGA